MTQKDNINSWTFGIITNGKKKEQLSKIIESIRAQKIPHYEIIICGTYFGPFAKDIVYIPFSEKDDKGWITKKKNIICENAKYENIVVVHDRIFFNLGWYKGMQKYGNDFDVLSCKITYAGERAYDWLTQIYPYDDIRSTWYLGGMLNYDDNDPEVYIDGGLIILKKNAWRKAKWDERLFWNEREDCKLSMDQHRAGLRIEFNKYSSCKTLSFNHPLSKLVLVRNKKGRLKLKGPIHIIIGKRLMNLWFYMRYIIQRIFKGKPIDFKY